nr:GYDIA family GHMP kinase [Winogradskyella sp.]
MVAERSRSYRSNGKLLITGEYLVLDGAKALALPTTFGQELMVNPNDSGSISWQSFDENHDVWFQDKFDFKKVLHTEYISDSDVSNRLIQIFKSIHSLNPTFFNSQNGFDIITRQDFNRKWGLGTSSTLINNMANWSNINAYELLKLTFGGSGYDIACAQNNTPIVYNLADNKPMVSSCNFDPIFKDCIYFVYLNQKQNSRDAISNYRTFKGDLETYIKKVNTITNAIIESNSLEVFNTLIKKHEALISSLIKQDTVKDRLFNDFDGEVKSLGAWGGDFVLVTSKGNPEDYFKSKGYSTILKYSEIIKA